MKLFILDCSVTMSWCFKNEHKASSAKILNALKTSRAIVPSIWALEVQNVLGVAERKHKITHGDSDQFMHLLSSLPIQVDSAFDRLFNKQLSHIVRVYQLSAYDAAYLELAIRHNAPLASYDEKLCNAAKEAGVKLFI